MSRRPIALSPDLLRLRNEGYDLDVIGGYLVIRDIPFVAAPSVVKRGILFMALDLEGDIAIKPKTHVAYWTGDHPCHHDGSKLRAFENGSAAQNFGDGLQADFTFSAKADYRDYHHKVTTYVGRISAEAAMIDASLTPMTFSPIPEDTDESVFCYTDTASSRAGIGAATAKVAGQKIGIIGVGGSGAYVLDLVAKTSVSKIHLVDGDIFSQHNAFRAPGAPTIDALKQRPKKVSYLASIYSNMHRGIVVHDEFIEEQNLSLLDGLDFVFVCLDKAGPKKLVVERLKANGTPFVEVGMGILLNDSQLGGIVRITTSTNDSRAAADQHISYADAEDPANLYATNIQIAELNSLTAAMAVIRWKKHFGVYLDTRSEVYAGYSIASGEIVCAGLR